MRTRSEYRVMSESTSQWGVTRWSGSCHASDDLLNGDGPFEGEVTDVWRDTIYVRHAYEPCVVGFRNPHPAALS